MKYLQLMDRLQKDRGFYYCIDERNSDTPNLFIILKVDNTSGSKDADIDIRDMYYCINGAIYKCPALSDVYEIRMAKAPRYLNEAFLKLLAERVKFDPHKADNNNNNKMNGDNFSGDGAEESNSLLAARVDNRVSLRMSFRDFPSTSSSLDSFKQSSYFDDC